MMNYVEHWERHQAILALIERAISKHSNADISKAKVLLGYGPE